MIPPSQKKPYHSLRHIRESIQELCTAIGRNPADIFLIGASKAQTLEKIQQCAADGLYDFGENYVQELFEKQAGLIESDPSLAEKLNWHYIGRLQRRKIKQLIGRVKWIHSVDRWELVQELEKRAAELEQSVAVLIQVNTGSEASKGGITADDVLEFMRSCNELEHVQIGGLMSLPPYSEDPEMVRPHFKQLRELRDAINTAAVYKKALRELSMGMSHDYRIAIEEGATMIRVGRALFGDR